MDTKNGIQYHSVATLLVLKVGIKLKQQVRRQELKLYWVCNAIQKLREKIRIVLRL